LEAITRLVADSLARHGFDRPVDPRRLQWSRWFRCDSTHSLLVVPSKPGLFALAEEVMDLGSSKTPVPTDREGHDFSRAAIAPPIPPDSAAEGTADGTHIAEAPIRRMLAVIQFSEDDDMAFTLDRMFTCVNPMRPRLASGRCFLRFVVIEDQAQRRNICNALNQWMLSSAEKATGITTDFQSLEPSSVARTPSSATAGSTTTVAQEFQPGPETDLPPAAHLDSEANKNRHCPHPLPSGF
jgi:hypothetical protein